MTDRYEFTIALRLRHPDIDPAEITRQLGLQPQAAWRAGEVRRDTTGEELDGTYRETYWLGRLMPEPRLSGDGVTVESVILQTLGQLRRAMDFLTALKLQGGMAELQISIYARGTFQLDLLAESLALLGRLGLAIALDIHPGPKPIGLGVEVI